MFDWIRSSYDLGPQFTNVTCQTKDIEDYGIGGTMSTYWISPSGGLYYLDYAHTADFVEIKEGDEEYNDKHLWCNFKWVPNGSRGKVTPWRIMKYIEVHTAEWSGKWEGWPRLRIHFRDGILQDYEDITGHKYD